MKRWSGRATTLKIAALFVCCGNHASGTEDVIDRLSQSAEVLGHRTFTPAYSDFSEPVGRFMDMLAAGSFAEAKELKPAACAAWLASRGTSPMTGQFWVWNTEVSMDALCAGIQLKSE